MDCCSFSVQILSLEWKIELKSCLVELRGNGHGERGPNEGKGNRWNEDKMGEKNYRNKGGGEHNDSISITKESNNCQTVTECSLVL